MNKLIVFVAFLLLPVSSFAEVSPETLAQIQNAIPYVGFLPTVKTAFEKWSRDWSTDVFQSDTLKFTELKEGKIYSGRGTFSVRRQTASSSAIIDLEFFVEANQKRSNYFENATYEITSLCFVDKTTNRKECLKHN